MNQKLGALLVFLAALAWSTIGLFTRVVTTDIPTTLFWRSLTGGLCILAVYLTLQYWRTGRASISEVLRFSLGEAVIGALIACGTACLIAAFFYTSIANVAFVYGTMPLMTVLLAWLVLKCKADWIALCACVFCIVGVAIIIDGAGQLDDFLGLAIALAMTFFMAAFTIGAKYFPAANVIKATYLSGFLCALAVLPFSSFAATTPSDYFWLALLGLVSSGLGFGVYLLGVQRTTATVAALVGVTEIPLAPIWAYLLFAENPGQNTIIGGAVILLATTSYLAVQYINQRRLGLV